MTGPEQCPAKPKELFEAQQRFVGRCGHATLRNITNLELIEIAPHENRDKYEQLGRFYSEAFFETADNAETDPVVEAGYKPTGKILIEQGFEIMGMMLSLGLEAYKVYCAENGLEANIDQLTAILEHPLTFDKVIKPLASYNSDQSKCFEMIYNLTPLGYSQHKSTRSTSMEVRSEDSSSLYMAPKSEYTFNAIQYVFTEFPEAYDVKHPYNYCPALEVLLPKAWPHMVDIATNHPDFFAADLAGQQRQFVVK